MKKLFILLPYFFISLSIAAQTTPVKNNPNDNFCNALSKVIAQAPGQFEKLKTGGYLAFLNPSTGSWVGNGWVASVNFPGAFLSNIEKLENGPNNYNAYFGNYQSEADARKEAGIIKNKLSTCLPGFTVEDRGYMENNFQGFPINFYFIEKKKGSSPQQIVNLYLGKDSSIHSIHLRIFGSDVNGTILQAIMKKPVRENWGDFEASRDSAIAILESFKGLDIDQMFKDPEKTKFAIQLEQLLNYAKDGFKTIRSEKIEEPKNERQAREMLGERPHVKYKSTFLPEGAERSEIRFYPDSSKFIYLAYFGDPLTHQDLFKKQFEKIKKELGDGFTYEANEKSIEWMFDMFVDQKAVFYRKDSKQFLIELKLNTITDIKEGMDRGVWLGVKAKN